MKLISCLFIISFYVLIISQHLDNKRIHINTNNGRNNNGDISIKEKGHVKKAESSIGENEVKGSGLSACLRNLKVGCMHYGAKYIISQEYNSSRGAWFKVDLELFKEKVELTLQRIKKQVIALDLSKINNRSQNEYSHKEESQSNANKENKSSNHNTSSQFNLTTTDDLSEYERNESNDNSTKSHVELDSAHINITNKYTGHLDSVRNSHFYGSYDVEFGLRGNLESDGVLYELFPSVDGTFGSVEGNAGSVNIEVLMVDQADWSYDWQEEELRKKIRRRNSDFLRRKNREGVDGSIGNLGVNKKSTEDEIKEHTDEISGSENTKNGRVNSDVSDYNETLGREFLSEKKSSNENRARQRKDNSARRLKRHVDDYDYEDYNDINENSNKNKGVHQRVCTINLKVTINYYKVVCQNSIQICVDRALWMLDFVNRFFRRVDFNFDGHLDNIGFVLHNFAVVDDPVYDELTDSIDILMKFAKSKQPRVCMNILLLNHALNEGVLGLAYIPKLQMGKSGGICYSEGFAYPKNYNSLLASERSLEGHVATRHVAITIMHELGHAFGAPHDVLDRCVAYRGFGNFVMFNSTNNLYNPNVLTFSICSRVYAMGIIEYQGTCFQLFEDYEFCGDYIIGGEEECDCGLDKKLCTEYDKCCTPPKNKVGSCKINRRKGYTCSQKNSPCCNYNCQIQTENKMCRKGDECMEHSYCNGYSFKCPESRPRTDGTPCAKGSKVCNNGRCIVSVCTLYGWQDCYCAHHSSVACVRCCRPQTGSKLCQPAHLIDLDDRLTSPVPVLESDTCSDGLGFCLADGRCQLLERGYTSTNELRSTLYRLSAYVVYFVMACLLFVAVNRGIAEFYYIQNENSLDNKALHTARLASLIHLVNSQKVNSPRQLNVLQRIFGKYLRLADNTVGQMSRNQAIVRLKWLFPTLKHMDIMKAMDNKSDETAVVLHFISRGIPMNKLFKAGDDLNHHNSILNRLMTLDETNQPVYVNPHR